jgi:hypothetical protein
MINLQFRVLYREFLFRIFDLELLSPDAMSDADRLLGRFAALVMHNRQMWSQMSAVLPAASVVMMVFAAVGTRVVPSLPIDLRANWIFSCRSSGIRSRLRDRQPAVADPPLDGSRMVDLNGPVFLGFRMASCRVSRWTPSRRSFRPCRGVSHKSPKDPVHLLLLTGCVPELGSRPESPFRARARGKSDCLCRRHGGHGADLGWRPMG